MSVLGGIKDNADRLRSFVPIGLVPKLVRRKTDKLWSSPEFRADCEAQMAFLLDHSERADEVPELAYGFAEQMVLRNHLRWHPKELINIELRDVDWLTTKRDDARPMVVSFMHHARYDGIWGALVAQHGVWTESIMTPSWMEPTASAQVKQHLKVCRLGTRVFPATGGTEQLMERFLTPGNRFVIAPDVPGRTPVRFLGKTVLGSFGSARMAYLTDSQCVVVTSHRNTDGRPYVQVHEPLEARDFADAAALNQAMLDIHGEAVLAWPEALEAPRARFGQVEDA